MSDGEGTEATAIEGTTMSTILQTAFEAYRVAAIDHAKERAKVQNWVDEQSKQMRLVTNRQAPTWPQYEAAASVLAKAQHELDMVILQEANTTPPTAQEAHDNG